VSLVQKAGIEVCYRTSIGGGVPLEQLHQTFDAVYLACGAQDSIAIGIGNADIPGIVSSTEFLRRVNENRPVDVGRRVLVIGGGNVAADCAITARRLGAKRVTIVCLEKEGEMAATDREVAQARGERVKILNGWGPESIITDHAKATGLTAKRCLSVFDSDGRFSPVYRETTTRQLEAETIVVAIGQKGRFDFLKETKDIELTKSGWVRTDPETQQTTRAGIFAGGDAARGPGMAIDAVADGKKAAFSIHRRLAQSPHSKRARTRRGSE
jgi:NADPH-dependent glutamate synthase beta subunit-like oxidoreductase